MEKGQSEATKKPQTDEVTPKVEPSTHIVDSKYAEHDIKLKRDHDNPFGIFKVLIIVLSIVLVLLGGFAIWFFAYYNQPDKIVFDAVEQVLQADHVSLQGGFSFMPKEASEDNPIKMILISFENSDKSLPVTNTANLQIIFDQNKLPEDSVDSITVKAKNIMLKDGAIYFQISGLADAFVGIWDTMAALDPEAGSIDYINNTGAMLDVIEQLISAIDDEWWRVSIDDLVAEMEDEESENYREMYGCAVSLADSDLSGAAASLYRSHRFVKVKPAKYLEPNDDNGHTSIEKGYNAYTISVDSQELADFVNAFPDTDEVQDFIDCYNGVAEKSDGKTISTNDISKMKASDFEWPEELHLSAEISKVGHKLRSVYADYDDIDNYTGGGSVLVKYDAAATEAPTEFRPISELYEEIANVIMVLFLGNLDYDTGFDESEIDNCSPDGIYGESTNCINEEEVWEY